MKQFLHFTSGTSCTHTSERLSDSYGLQCAELSLPVGYLTLEICFIYILKLGIEGRISISTHSPPLQFVTRLSDSLKAKAKGVVLVKGLWFKMSGSPGLTPLPLAEAGEGKSHGTWTS